MYDTKHDRILWLRILVGEAASYVDANTNI